MTKLDLRLRSHVVWMALGVVLSGCASQSGIIPPPLTLPQKAARKAAVPPSYGPTQTVIEQTPTVPAPSVTSTVPPTPPAGPKRPEKADITLSFDQMPLPTFIQVVYGKILKVNFTMDPQVAARTDLVTLRTGKPQTASQVADIARMLLKSYGVAVTEISPGFYRMVPNDTTQGYAPEIIRGWALPQTPMPLRPIFQLVELHAVRNPDVAGWIRTMFGQRVQVQEDPDRNAVLLSGQSDDVEAALNAIHVLDQPLMKGRHSVRIDPVFWSADALAKKLDDILNTEGYATGTASVGINYPITILPIDGINAIIAFAADPAVLQHIVEWAKTLDKPSPTQGAGSRFFVYHVRNTDAGALAKTMRELMSSAPAAPPTTGPGAASQTAATGPQKIVVDPGTNSLIFEGNPQEYTQMYGLLRSLDKPAKEALIDVTVAELNLNNTTQLGVEWLLGRAGIGSYTVSGGTLGNLGLGTAGLTLTALNGAGQVRAVLNALATTSNAQVLSSPDVLAQNGETATIQVGAQVPVITSQQTSPTTGSSSILQSVQYLNTGVILKVKPVIHSDDRIDLTVSQEVSSAVPTTTGVSASPTINTRKLETKLTLKDGSTVLLGGLISDSNTKGDTGVPGLKDIPVIGQLFRNRNDNRTKDELIMLITPYIVSDDQDAQAITEAFRNQLGPWAQKTATHPGR